MFLLPVDLLAYISKYSYLLSTLVVLQGSLMLVLLYMFVEKLVNTRRRRLDREIERQEAFAEAVKILEDSKLQSLRILEESHKKARDIIGQFQGISHEAKKELTEQMLALGTKHVQDLQRISQSFSDDYKQVLKEEKERSVAQIHETSEEVKHELLGEVSEFKEVLRDETYRTQEGVKKKITDEYAAVREEIETYRKQKLAAIDESVFQLVYQVIKDVLGISLSLDEKQELVLTILEKAKRESRWTQ